MTTLGVIPAAGTGERWGGFYKELLPCGDGQWLLDRTVEAMRRGGADAVLVVTRQGKVAAHVEHLHDAPVPVLYTKTTSEDMYGAFEASFASPADDYLFAMPDTYYPLDAFECNAGHAFGMGVFRTRQPERFGVMLKGHVHNKQRLPAGQYDAWGVLRWTRRVVRYWQDAPPVNYTDAINLALGRFNTYLWELDYYHDMASFEDYREWIRANGN